MSDNYRFLLASEGLSKFETIMRLAFRSNDLLRGHTATHYEIDPKYGMILYSDNAQCYPGIMLLPYPMNTDAAIPFVWNWLLTAIYPKNPEHDGSNRKGFVVFNEEWGHVKGRWEAFVAIKPEWQMYGK